MSFHIKYLSFSLPSSISLSPAVFAKEIDELDEEDEGREKENSLLRRARDDAETRLASMGIGKGRDASGSSIPDQATIDAIRARREKWRQSGAAAPDFISLDGGSNHGVAEGLSDEESEFRGKIAMFGNKMEGGKKGVFEDIDERGIDSNFRKVVDDVDDDEDEEEKTLGRRAVQERIGVKMDDGSSRAVTSSNAPVVLKHSVRQQKYAYPTVFMVAQKKPTKKFRQM